jgi:hypothetical protein
VSVRVNNKGGIRIVITHVDHNVTIQCAKERRPKYLLKVRDSLRSGPIVE